MSGGLPWRWGEPIDAVSGGELALGLDLDPPDGSSVWDCPWTGEALSSYKRLSKAIENTGEPGILNLLDGKLP
jgi:hypothetical protein